MNTNVGHRPRLCGCGSESIQRYTGRMTQMHGHEEQMVNKGRRVRSDSHNHSRITADKPVSDQMATVLAARDRASCADASALRQAAGLVNTSTCRMYPKQSCLGVLVLSAVPLLRGGDFTSYNSIGVGGWGHASGVQQKQLAACSNNKNNMALSSHSTPTATSTPFHTPPWLPWHCNNTSPKAVSLLDNVQHMTVPPPHFPLPTNAVGTLLRVLIPQFKQQLQEKHYSPVPAPPLPVAPSPPGCWGATGKRQGPVLHEGQPPGPKCRLG